MQKEKKTIEEEITESLPPNSEEATIQAEETPTDTEAELEALRSEVERLRQTLEEKDAAMQKANAELEEFSSLFPDTNVNSLPESVWESVRTGNSLAAAYALYEKKLNVENMRIREINEKNSRQSSGRLGTSFTSEYFTPDEVRAMSQSEVRANYSKIIESMKKWN